MSKYKLREGHEHQADMFHGNGIDVDMPSLFAAILVILLS